MMDGADPLDGWSTGDIMKKESVAKNDIYGSLYYYLHGLFWQFCHRVGQLKINIQLSQLDALELPGFIKQYIGAQHCFDRIEVRYYCESALSSFNALK